jgi:hypothetical protein
MYSEYMQNSLSLETHVRDIIQEKQYLIVKLLAKVTLKQVFKEEQF